MDQMTRISSVEKGTKLREPWYRSKHGLGTVHVDVKTASHGFPVRPMADLVPHAYHSRRTASIGGPEFPTEETNFHKGWKEHVALEPQIDNVAEVNFLRAAFKDENRFLRVIAVDTLDILEDKASASAISKLARNHPEFIVCTRQIADNFLPRSLELEISASSQLTRRMLASGLRERAATDTVTLV
jgi:hypothetical protein